MKKSTPIVFGENFGKVFGEPWAELGKTIGKGISELFCEDAAIVLAPDGVHLNELAMIIPWNKVYDIQKDENANLIKIMFVGCLEAIASDADYDVEDEWDKAFVDAPPDEFDMDEDELRETVTKPDGINILKTEWERRLTSAIVAHKVLETSLERTRFDCGASIGSAIEFGKVYVNLPDSMKQQIYDPEEVKFVLEFWLDLAKALEDENGENHQTQIRDLQTLIAEFDASSVVPDDHSRITNTPLRPVPQGDYTREEALFRKRARRYATNDGEIDAKERADLEALAMKMGIDELRAEELIEEAFGQ